MISFSSAGAESIDGGFAARRILSALKNYRPCTGTGKHQRREHPGRAEADDDGPPLEMELGKRRCGLWLWRRLDIAVAAQLLQHLLLELLIEPDVEDVDELDGRTVITARVDSLTHNYHPGNLLRW